MSTTRKLAAIVFVDIVSYTAMMGKDEKATLGLLEELRKILYPLVQSHKGTVLKELGDGALMSFDSALDATDCAIELQRDVKKVPNLKLRIGIHLGDVVVEEKDVFGSGVNVAARVQPLAAPGGIVVTEDVWKQIKNQPVMTFVSLESRRLKGVSTAVKVLAIKGDGLAVPHVKQRMMQHRAFKPSLAALCIAVLATLSYLFVPEVRQLTTGEVPSIAILYLKNLGPESDEPFTYGITQDLIVDVAKAGLIRVASMKDILALQKTDLPTEKIAEQLRVRYVMEGSLRREANSFRLSGQIVEAATGKTLWADRIQTKVNEASLLQGKLAEVILSALQVRPSAIVAKEITGVRTTNPEAYEFYLRAKYLFDHKKTKEDVTVAPGLYEKTLALDSAFVEARIGLGSTYELEGEYERAQKMYEIALSEARRNQDKVEEATSLLYIGGVRMDLGEYSEAIDYFTKSLALYQELGDRDGEARVLNNFGIIYKHQGEYPKAIDYFSKGFSLAQKMGYKRMEGVTLLNLGTVYHSQDKLSEALDHYLRALSDFEELGDHRASGLLLTNIGVVYQNQGKYPKALEYFDRSLKIARDLGDRRSELSSLLNIGVVYDEQGDFRKALDYYTMSLGITRQHGDRRNESQALLNIGTIYSQEENFNKAWEYYNQSLAIRKELSDRPGEGETLGYMGKLLVQQGKYDRAAEALEKATNIFKELEEKELETWSASWLALVESKSGNLKNAEEGVRKIEELLTTMSKSSYYYSEVLLNVSQVYSLLGNSQKAAQYIEQAYNSIKTRAQNITDRSLRQMFFSNVKTHREIIAAWEEHTGKQR